MIKLISTFLLMLSIIYPQDIKDKVNLALHNCFGDNISIEYEKVKIDNELKIQLEREVGQKFFSDEVYFYKIQRDQKKIGFALLDNVYGKSLPITFIVMYDLNRQIKCSEIIKYREPYGGAVQNKEWNNQFKGKTSDSELVVGKDIQSISGATISVNSVTKGIKKLTLLLKSLLTK